MRCVWGPFSGPSPAISTIPAPNRVEKMVMNL